MSFVMVALGIVLAFVLLCILRALKGPSIWDRLLGINLVSTKLIIIIAAFASYSGLTYLLDFALIYALTGFICTIFISTFLLEYLKKEKK